MSALSFSFLFLYIYSYSVLFFYLSSWHHLFFISYYYLLSLGFCHLYNENFPFPYLFHNTSHEFLVHTPVYIFNCIFLINDAYLLVFYLFYVINSFVFWFLDFPATYFWFSLLDSLSVKNAFVSTGDKSLYFEALCTLSRKTIKRRGKMRHRNPKSHWNRGRNLRKSKQCITKLENLSRVLNCCIVSIFTYDSESWTISFQMIIVAIKTFPYRRIPGTPTNEHVSKEEILVEI